MERGRVWRTADRTLQARLERCLPGLQDGLPGRLG